MRLKKWAATAALVALCASSNAALVSLGDGTVKDTSSNLVWLADWNVNGAQTWAEQMAWAEGLTYANSSDWYLPSIEQYRALFAGYGFIGNLAEFTNVQAGYYLSSTQTVSSVSTFLASGLESGDTYSYRAYAVAARSADATNAVPEPQTLALALLALGATVLTSRRSASKPLPMRS